MSKTILYLNNQYIRNYEQIKDLVASPRLIKDDLFRREILSAYRDGILDKWCEDRGIPLNISSKSSHDDDVFIALYKEIAGENECPNFHSDFSKLGEFLRCEIENKTLTINNGEIVIDTINTELTIKFIFKSFKAENNIRLFTLKDNDKCVGKVECNWNDKIKGKEHFIELSFNPSKYEGTSLTLIEGNDNRLCKLVCKFPEYKEFELNGETLKFFYVSSMKCWIGKLPRKAQFKTLDAYTKKYAKYKFKLLTSSDIDRLKKESKIWDKLKNNNFWVFNGQYYNSFYGEIEDVSSWKRDSERHQCWLKLKDISTLTCD